MRRRWWLGLLGVALAACSSDEGGVAGAGGAAGSAGSTAGAGGSAGQAGAASGGSGGGVAGGGSGGSAGSSLDPCEPIAGAAYESQVTVGPVSDHPAPEHADLNLKLRGWSPTGGTLGLVDIAGPTDALAPRLNTLLSDDRIPALVANYRVNEWDWGTNSAGPPITAWEVTLTGFGTTPGEVLELPQSGYEIGPGKQARVLFADDDSITLKYTAEDNVVSGYTIHVVGLCVEPSLRLLYDANDAAGRSELPALAGEQPIGRARGSEVLVTIRDTGAFMDPRSKKDWW